MVMRTTPAPQRVRSAPWPRGGVRAARAKAVVRGASPLSLALRPPAREAREQSEHPHYKQ